MKLLRSTSLPSWNKGKTKADDPRIEKLAVWKGKENLKKRTRVGDKCLVCDKSIERTPSQIKAGIKKHCSNKCANITKSNKTKGRPFPEGQKKLLSALKKGKSLHPKVLEGYKKKFPNGRFGKLAGNWKGGITTQNKLERKRFRIEVQPQVFKRDVFKCLDCGATNDLQVAHIKGWSKYPELRFKLSNCRTLCKNCHYKETFGRDIPDKNMLWGRNFYKAKIEY